jgi:DNA-binding GntR family transcriptional regulator
MVKKALTPPTKQALAFERLRHDILRGRLRPGDRLVIDRIAGELGISAIPVREALRQLEKQGLVEIRPHAGARVSDIPESAIEEIFGMLEVLETASCRLGLSRLKPDCFAEMERLCAKMECASSPERWQQLNRVFHEYLPGRAGLSRLEQALRRVGEDWERLRRLRFSAGQREDQARADRQHREIVCALRKGDGEGAANLLRRHNREALRLYVPAAAEPPSQG